MSLELIKSKIIFKGRMVDFKVDTLRTDDGTEHDREILVHPGAAVIIPLLDRDHVALIRQYRHASERNLWEFPAGTLEPGEATEACARRELIEEIGYEAKKWTALLSFFPSPGISTERMFLFLAEDLVQVTERPLEADTITLRPTPVCDLLAMLERGEILDAKTIIGVYYLLVRQNRTDFT